MQRRRLTAAAVTYKNVLPQTVIRASHAGTFRAGLLAELAGNGQIRMLLINIPA